MSIGKIVGLGVGACLVVVIVGASAALKVIIDVIEGPDQRYRDDDWPM